MAPLLLYLVIAILCLSLAKATDNEEIQDSCDHDHSKYLRNLDAWLRTNPVLQKQDEERHQILTADKPDKTGSTTSGSRLASLRDRFYKLTSVTFQTACGHGKLIGGRWVGRCGFFDCQKYVCFDRLYGDIVNNECLIYSFGIGEDWSFETSMASMGCKVRAFDVIDIVDPDFLGHPNITFTRKGLYGKMPETEVRIDGGGGEAIKVKTLSEFIADLSDAGKKISYLKVDVEGYEIAALPDWIDSGVLDVVDQIGMEVHTGTTNLKKDQLTSTYEGLIRDLRSLHAKGFRNVYYDANGCDGKATDFTKKYHALFDIVLLKMD